MKIDFMNVFSLSFSTNIQNPFPKSFSEDLILQNLILRTRSCGSGFITQPRVVLHFDSTKMVGQKYFVPLRYQLSRGMLRGPALK